MDWLTRLAAALGCEPWAVVSPSADVARGEEVELLALFRGLDREEKQAALGYVGLLADVGVGTR